MSDFYPPFLGGAERQTQVLATALARRGHEIRVATVWHAGQPEREDDSGVTVHRLKGLVTRVPWFSTDPTRRFHPPFPEPGIVWSMRRLIREFAPDVVHSCGWITYSCTAALVGREVPLLVSAREYGYSCAIRTLMYHGRELCAGPAPIKCLRCATHVYDAPKALVAVSGVLGGRSLLGRKTAGVHSISRFVQQVIRRDLVRVEGPSSHARRRPLRQRVIPDVFVDDDARQDDGVVRELLARLPADPFILFVGALQPHKGVELLLAAYEQLVSPPPLALIGTVWPETPHKFPPGVTVLYDVPHHGVMAAWERCLFGVAPSVWPEPLGNVIFEAMSKGKATIGTTPGGHEDMIIDGETGLLVPAGQVEPFVYAMRRLIDDPELRERLGRVARDRVRLFRPDSVIPRFEAVYQELIDARARIQG